MYRLLFGQQAIWNNANLLLRVWVGVIFIYHGLSIWNHSNMQGFADTLWTENIPFPLLSAWLCKTSEFFGGIFLVVDFLKRPAVAHLLLVTGNYCKMAGHHLSLSVALPFYYLHQTNLALIG